MKKNRNVFRMIKYFFRCKKATIYAGIMCVLGLLVGIVTPICNKLIQDDIIPNKNISLFIWLTIVILILNLVSTLSSYFTTRIFINNGVVISSNIRKDILKINIFSRKNIKNKGKVMISGTTFLEDANLYYISYMYLIFDSLLKFLFYFPFFVFYGGYLALIMLGATIISFGFIAIADKYATRYMHETRIVEAERYEYMLKMLDELECPDFVENEEINMVEYLRKVRACDRTWLGYCNWANTYTYIFNLIWYIGVAVCFCLVYEMLAVGAIVLSTFIIFNSYLDQLKAPINNYANYKVMAVRYDETFGKFFEELDDEELLELKDKKIDKKEEKD